MMTINIGSYVLTMHFGWWTIPAILTAMFVVWALWPSRTSGSTIEDLAESFNDLAHAIVGLVILVIVWIIAGALK